MKGIYIEHPRKGIITISEEPLTVLQLHRKLQDMADDMVTSGEHTLDITDDDPSWRYDDFIIEIFEPYKLTPESIQNLSCGALIMGDEIIDLGVTKEEIYEHYYTGKIKWLKDKNKRHIPWHLKSDEEQNRLTIERYNRDVDFFNAVLGPFERLFLGLKRKKV